MSQQSPPLNNWDAFVQMVVTTDPRFRAPLQIISEYAPESLKKTDILQSVFGVQDCVVQMLSILREHIAPENLCSAHAGNTPQCHVWCNFAVLLMIQGKAYQALELADALYVIMLDHQVKTRTRFHKGAPLFRMNECHHLLAQTVHAKRYMMLTLCEDAVTSSGNLDLHKTGSYGKLAWLYGLSDTQIRRYAKEAYSEYTRHQAEAATPEWLLQHLDQDWKTEIPSAQEAGVYHITRHYCELLLGRLGAGDGKDLERLAEYLVGSMTGCRTYRRLRTHSTDYDIIASAEGPISDFRSELGRYFVCECKDKMEDKASFTDIAKFCRVLDSVKAKFGIIFCTTGHSGAGKASDADREILKVYQDRGVVIVVVDRHDLEQVAKGANFVSILREKYEVVRLDLRS